MPTVTLGGERLGAGKKMRINLPGHGRSSHDQGMVFTTDMGAGMLVPCYCNVALRGDTIYFDDISSIVRTLPTLGPVFGTFKQQIDVFVAPIRLYIGPLHNNATGIGLKMNQVMFPKKEHITTMYTDDLKLKNPGMASVSPSSLAAYLGQRGSKTGGGYVNSMKYRENAIFDLMYWDVYKNYYANKQEEQGVVVAGKTKYTSYPYSDIEFTLVEYRPDGPWLYSKSSQKTSSNGQRNIQAIVGAITLTQAYGVNRDQAAMIVILPSNVTKTQEGVEAWLEQLNLVSGGRLVAPLYKKDGTGIFQKFVIAVDYSEVSLKFATDNPGDEKTYTFQAGQGISTQINQQTETIQLERFDLSNIDKMRERILSTGVGSELLVNEDKSTTGIPYNIDTETFIDGSGLIRERRAQDFCGLAVKTHLSDIFNNWIQTDWLDGDNGINDLTAIDTTSGSFTINEFIMDYKLFRMMNKIAISDGSYDAWQTAVYGVEGKVITESPIYCGGYSAEIGFDEVVSSAATYEDGAEEPLGSLAGRGATQMQTRKGGRGIKIKCDEASLIMVLVSFTPRNSYSQYQDWWMNLNTMDDLHKPDLDGIAFQDLLDGSMATWSEVVNSDGTISRTAVGKQVPWVEYTTNFNRTFGSFSAGGELEHMVLNRVYIPNTSTGHVANATSYIDPTESNTIFADSKLTAKPFWVQIGFDETSRRVMSASQMPTL